MRERLEWPDRNLVYRPKPWAFEYQVHRLSRTCDLAELVYRHNQEIDRLHAELIAGDEWRQDYEAYRRELIALRQRALEAVEDFARRAERSLRFSRRKRLFVAGDEGASISPTVLGGSLLAAVGLGGVVVAKVWFGRRKAA